jgi:hypothetical protein
VAASQNTTCALDYLLFSLNEYLSAVHHRSNAKIMEINAKRIGVEII